MYEEGSKWYVNMHSNSIPVCFKRPWTRTPTVLPAHTARASVLAFSFAVIHKKGRLSCECGGVKGVDHNYVLLFISCYHC